MASSYPLCDINYVPCVENELLERIFGATRDKHETDMSDNLKSLLARTNDILGQGKFSSIFIIFWSRVSSRWLFDSAWG